MHVARAMDVDRLVLNSGAKSERHVRALYPGCPHKPSCSMATT